LPPFDEREQILSVWNMIWPLMLDERRIDPLMPRKMLDMKGVSRDAEKVGAIGNFNIIRYQGRYFGIRQSVGAVDCRIGVASQLALFGPENVVIGDDEESVREGILARIGVEDGDLSRATRSSASEGPEMVESLYGFNIVRAYGRYIGLRQSAGQVDCRIGEGNLIAQLGPHNAVFGNDIDTVREAIVALKAQNW